MAEQNYIAYEDISHRHVLRFPETTVQGYIDEANDQYEDLASQKGVEADDLAFPVPLVATRYLRHYVTERLTYDMSGNADNPAETQMMYLRVSEAAMDKREVEENKLTPELMRGTADSNPSSRSVNMGRIRRTS